MSNISNIPLEDGFSTSLTRSWDGSVGTIYVASTPSFTFPSGITTYIVVNPGKSNMQLATINAYNSSLKTMTVSSITLNKGASVASTANPHSVGSKVIISDNYQFWADIISSLNSKVDGDTQPFPSYTTSGRDALTASNGMVIYNSTTGELNQYISGSWSAISAGSTQPNASLTVAGKVEIATDAEVTAGTATGGTGASLVITPEQQKKSISLKGAGTTFGDTDEIVVNISGVDYRITGANLRESIAASTTSKGTVEMATDAEVATGTDETRYINAKQAKDNYTNPSYVFSYSGEYTARQGYSADGATFGTTTSGIHITPSGVGTTYGAVSFSISKEIFNGNPFLCGNLIGPENINPVNQMYFGLGGITVSGASGHTFTDSHIGFKAVYAGSALYLYGTVANGTTESVTSALTIFSGYDISCNVYLKFISSSIIEFGARVGGDPFITETITTNIPTLTLDSRGIQFSYRAGNTSVLPVYLGGFTYSKF